MNEPNIQHKPAIRVGMDTEVSSDAAWENDKVVPVQPASQDFDYPENLDESGMAEQETHLAFDQRQATCTLLALLTDGDACAKTVGQRALALQYILKASPYLTQKELAKRLGVKPARASQTLKSIREIIAG